MSSLNTCLKWESVRNGLKTQAVDTLLGPQHADDELPEFGSSFASSAMSNAIDEEVRPDKLGMLVDHLLPHEQPGAPQTLFGLMRHVHMHFTHPGVFEASVIMPGHENETPLRLQMRIHAFQWKIHRVDLPAPGTTRWSRHRQGPCPSHLPSPDTQARAEGCFRHGP